MFVNADFRALRSIRSQTSVEPIVVRVSQPDEGDGRGDSVAASVGRDEVDYEMKMGAAGELAHSLIVKAQMQRLFSYRQQQFEKILAKIVNRK